MIDTYFLRIERLGLLGLVIIRFGTMQKTRWVEKRERGLTEGYHFINKPAKDLLCFRCTQLFH